VTFDKDLPENMGRPIYWDLQRHIAAIIQMIQSDELQIALRMCDDVPGWYRDNYPRELLDIKRKIYEQTYDQVEYATDDEEAQCSREFGEAQWDNGYMHPRAEIISQIVKECVRPWIFDLGCSHGNLPLGLIKSGHEFSYRGVGMNHRIQNKVKEWVGEYWADKPKLHQTTILYCTEVIEHCFNPHDVIHTAKKTGVDFDRILLSVPYATLGGGLENWSTRRLGHVRTWTGNEFVRFAEDNFKGYQWTLYMSDSMVLVGRK
jgi:hypothetical protein